MYQRGGQRLQIGEGQTHTIQWPKENKRQKDKN